MAAGGSFGLSGTWQETWAWFMTTSPQMRYPIAVAAVAAAVVICVTAAMKVGSRGGKLASFCAAALVAAAGLAPGPVIGAILSVVDWALTAATGFFNR
jgi:hypothetical protein